MKNTVKINSVELINADSLHYIARLPDNSIDLIVTDPPYFRVKPEGWDNQWKGDEDFLRWLDGYLAEFWRVLKPGNVSLVINQLNKHFYLLPLLVGYTVYILYFYPVSIVDRGNYGLPCSGSGLR